MIKVFQTYEAASFFVQEKQSEGYHAHILNESTAFLWGPRTVGGFRVFVSDEPSPDSEPLRDGETEEESPLHLGDSLPVRILRFAVIGFLFLGLLGALVTGLSSPSSSLKFLLSLGAVLAFIIGTGYLVSQRNFRKPPR